MKRRTVLSAVSGIAAVSFAGCSEETSESDNPESSTDTNESNSTDSDSVSHNDSMNTENNSSDKPSTQENGNDNNNGDGSDGNDNNNGDGSDGNGSEDPEIKAGSEGNDTDEPSKDQSDDEDIDGSKPEIAVRNVTPLKVTNLTVDSSCNISFKIEKDTDRAVAVDVMVLSYTADGNLGSNEQSMEIGADEDSIDISAWFPNCGEVTAGRISLRKYSSK